MWQLNLPSYNFNIKKNGEKIVIFDQLRKKFVALTPEEWVRQHFIQFLISEKQYPASLTVIEKVVNVNGMQKRCDAVIYNQNLEPVVILEFKAPGIIINNKTFDQAAVYNSKLNVKYLIISNGIDHYMCEINIKTRQYIFFEEILLWKELQSRLQD